MFDLVIRNGTVLDGSGAPRRIADVAVQDGKIAAVGPKLGTGRREIDAAGLIVAPGFVDIHTHYDGQATWDPFVTPSLLAWRHHHGVRQLRRRLRAGAAGQVGLPDQPDGRRRGHSRHGAERRREVRLGILPATISMRSTSMRRAVDVAAQLPHGALRFYVMGERGADHAEVPNEREIEEMARLTEEALRAGAMGFTTSRTTKHKAKDGRFTPSLSAREAELLGIAAGMKRAGRGVLQVNSDFGPGEFEALRGGGRRWPAGRCPACWCRSMPQPKLWRETLDQIHGVRQAGRAANAQVGSRPIGVIMGLETTAHPFAAHPAWLEMRKLSPAERHARLAGRCRAAPPPGRDAGRWRLARLHGRVVPQDVPGGRAARLRARCRRTRSPPSPNAAAARRRRWRSTR